MQKKNLLLLICVLFSILYLDAKTSVKKIDDTYYILDTDKMVAAITHPKKGPYDFTTQGGAFRIPSTVVQNKKEYKVISIGEGAFKGCKTLKSLAIPNSITIIERNAFEGCTALTTLTLEDGVTDLKLNYNYNIKQIYSELARMIVGKEKVDEKKLFNDCPLEKLYLGRNLSYVGEFYKRKERNTTYETAFNNKTTIKEITIGNTVTSIEECAFEGCRGLTRIVISSSVTSIGDNAFNCCSSLKFLTLEDGGKDLKLGQIDGYTPYYTRAGLFNGCPLENIYLGRNLSYIYDSQKGYSPFYSIKTLKEIIIGNSVTSIGWYAFRDCSGLKSVVIPNSITKIGNEAFYGCSGLTSITISNSVTSIEEGTFSGCSSLVSIVIPNSVTSIGENAFRGCSALTNVTIPNSVTKIGSWAFDGCTSLTSMEIPESNINIAHNAFNDCPLSLLSNIGRRTKLDYNGTVQLMEKDGQYGIVSTQTGEYIVPLGKYSWINNTRIKGSDTSLSNINPYLTVKEPGSDLVGLINMYSGKLIIPAQYKSFKIIIGSRWADIIVAWDENGNMSLYNDKGTLIVPSGKYDLIGREHGTYLVVGKNKKKGLIDYTNGKVIFPPKHDEFIGTAGSRLVFADNGNPGTAYVYSGDGKLLTSKKFNTWGTREMKVWLINNGLQNMMLYD